ncbi:MAG: amidohydrolase family protein [Acidimicrobiaceae bacterium]|nr:amidohydrolase family protein [Acidimicrobiaceae bacterium]MXW74821.1 amidohydrolase family protein [Acidimicrobiaceae bacterium]MYC41986.1 amidohydrolase family protein [Acidimicrobiaceae bacterium]MYD08052.1 amidohydrolase family protein [Acidimicrobiaceae bacterium]MYH88742.1 amidohydrolase family protein [Acidimicrobiaceae bacterium]
MNTEPTDYGPTPEVTRILDELDHPVIDTDGHVIEFLPWVRDLVVDIAGNDVAKRFDQMVNGSAGIRQVPTERRRQAGVTRSAWWGLPARNTLDRATAMLPELLYQRLDQIGVDVALLYPTYGLTVTAYPDDELRQAMARAFNIYMARAYEPYGDRLIGVASIPMFTPDEALAELDHAVGTLGLRAVMLSGVIPRPLPGAQDHRAARFMNGVGHDSEYDYDPVWKRCEELGVCPTFHASGQGWGTRASRTNYVYNHIGNFATAGEAAARSLLLGGAPMRFPDLRWAFLEGGVGWGANLLGDAIGHFEKRNVDGIKHYDPAAIDRDQLQALFDRHGTSEHSDRISELDYALTMLSDANEDRSTIDEWAESQITTVDELIEIFRDRFYFGCEADDPMNALAYRTDLLPGGIAMRAIFASDIGHWDVPDIREVLPEAYELVEKGLISPADFRRFTFEDPVRLFTAQNPDFFASTTVAEAARTVAAS